MTQFQDVFERYEKKYMLNEYQYQILTNLIQEKMQQDQYGKHTICNIYYDTPEFNIIRTSLEKPEYKEKLRLRSYGIPDKDSTVFLELKKKYHGIVYKRRISLPLSEAENYLQDGIRPHKDCQILHEMDWFLKQNNVSEKVYLAYDRIALFSICEQDLRITFDQNIRWRDNTLSLSNGDWGNLLMSSEKILMEIKILGAMPYWLSTILSELEIYPATFSKYGDCYKNHLIHQNNIFGGVICA